jgi:hypothetical protein
MEAVLDRTADTTVYVDLCRIEAGQDNLARARKLGADFEAQFDNLSPALLAVLAYCYRVAGANDDAIRVAAMVDAAAETGEVSAISHAYADLARNDLSAAIADLERTINQPVSLPIAANVMYIKQNVFRDPTFERPEFVQIRERIGFQD